MHIEMSSGILFPPQSGQSLENENQYILKNVTQMP